MDETSQGSCVSTADCENTDPSFYGPGDKPTVPSVTVHDFLKIPRLKELGGQFERINTGAGELKISYNLAYYLTIIIAL